MRLNNLHAIWAEGRCALNAWLSIGSSYSAEVLAHLPYQAVTVDLQHGMFGTETAMAMLQAISTSDAVPMVRVPDNTAATIQRVLDMGAYGIICPMINSRVQCEAFVAAIRYPPLGQRSFGPSRGLLYGGHDYAARANETIVSWAMIETREALQNLEEIASVEGLSGLYIGPSDLSMTMEGAIASPLSESVMAEVQRIIEVARTHDLRVGIFCPDVAFAKKMIAAGCSLVTVMNDAGLLRKATSDLLAQLS